MVKFIKELNQEEKNTFLNSELRQIMSHDFYFSPFASHYNAEYFGNNYRDTSLIVFHKKTPIIAFYAFTNDDSLTFYGWPITIFHTNDDENIINEGFKELFAKIKELRSTNQIQKLSFYKNKYFISKYFYKIQSVNTQHHAIIDLELSSENIKANIRKSNKPQLNWGKENLKIIIVDHQNNDSNLFYNFKKFHIAVSGRQTRSNATWDIQYEMLKNNQAYLVLGYLGEKLAAGTFILHGSEIAYYGVTVNDRELMKEKLPVGYYPILVAINHAKQIGLKKFHMNRIDQNQEDSKLNNLANFKEGFTSTLETVTAYHIQL